MVVRQIVYYGDFNVLNNPISLNSEKLTGDFVLEDVIYNEVQIKAFSGAMLEINGQKITIGDVELYDIMYKEKVNIVTIRFSQETLRNINQSENKYVVITLMKKD